MFRNGYIRDFNMTYQVTRCSVQKLPGVGVTIYRPGITRTAGIHRNATYEINSKLEKSTYHIDVLYLFSFT
jgi:hypothetical protein